MQFFKIAFIALIGVNSIQSMEISKLAKEVALTTWPDAFYAQVFPGKTLKFVERGELAKFKDAALKATKENTATLKLESKEAYDWIYALIWAEKHLLTKPFEKWTLNDLCTLNACLTRLTEETQGKFRPAAAWWETKELTEQERARYNKILDCIQYDKLPTPEDQAWFKENTHGFPPAHEVSQLLEFYLKETQRLVKAYEQEGKGITALIAAACQLNFHIVEVHPWRGAHKRTGMLVMALILAQYAIDTPAFTDRSAYSNCFLKHLKEGNYRPLFSLVLELIEKQYAP